jgi:hypothetical protein
MQLHVISFYGVTSRIMFMFLLFPQVSRNLRYESQPPLKPSPQTCYKRTRLSCWCLCNHKRCTYRAPVRYVTKTWSVVLLNETIHILLSEVYCVWQVVKTTTIISNNPVEVTHFTVQIYMIHLMFCYILLNFHNG